MRCGAGYGFLLVLLVFPVMAIVSFIEGPRRDRSYGSSLHSPGDAVLRDPFLGSREIADSRYNRLTKALRERLGDRFTVEEKV